MAPDNQIHPTAIMDGNIRIGSGNIIGPHVVIRGDITIGDNNTFDTGVCIEHHVRIESDNHFYPYVCVGSTGEMGAKGDRLVAAAFVTIGNKVTLREFVCIHSPVYHEATIIADDVYIMNKSYVAHDCVIGKGVVMSAGVLLGGRCVIEPFATLGMNTVVHQRRCVGKGAMIGMSSVVTRDILPYSTVAGNPARIMGFNKRGAERFAFDRAWIEEMEVFFSSGIEEDIASPNPMKKEISTFLLHHPDSLKKVKSK